MSVPEIDIPTFAARHAEGVTLVEPQAASVHFKYVQAPPQP